MMIFVIFIIIGASVSAGHVSVAASSQYLYKMPPSSAITSVKRGKKEIHGPIVATPDKGANTRWSDEMRNGDNKNTEQSKQDEVNEELSHVAINVVENEQNREAINKLYDQGFAVDRILSEAEIRESINAQAVYRQNNSPSRREMLEQELREKRLAKKKHQHELDNNKDTDSYEKDLDDFANENKNRYKEAGLGYGQNSIKNTFSQQDLNKIKTVDSFYGMSKDEMKRKITEYNKALELEFKKSQSEEKEKATGEAVMALFGIENDFTEIEREGDDIIIYKQTKNQKRAKDTNVPQIPQIQNPNWRFQVLPSNIAQKVYDMSNNHLKPVVFQYEIDQNAFKLTSIIGSITKLKAILPDITNINMQDIYGNTLLLHCITNVNYECMKFLLQSGANLDLANDFGITPIHLSVYKQDYISIKIILQASPSTNVVDSNGLTPLMYAVILGDASIVKLLIEYGSNVDFANNKGMTAISIADEYNDIEVLAYLKERSLNHVVAQDMATDISEKEKYISTPTIQSVNVISTE
ncbi:MAG: ankyrin repeat domain-containing protein [Alphaproteobacteria bacterium]|nr:ankyrin repeat domain-containing protein [Rickettsiales bacterium]